MIEFQKNTETEIYAIAYDDEERGDCIG